MKILFFVSSMNAGGAERVAASLANAWTQRGDEVCLVPTHLGTDSSFYALDQAVRFQPLATRMSWFPPLLTPLRKLRAIRQVYDDFAPDVVVSFLTNVNVNVLMALRGVKAPIIVCERTNPVVSQSANGVLQKLRAKLYPRAKQVVVQTEDAANAFSVVAPHLGKLAVIANPIAPQLMALPKNTTLTKTSDCCLIAMGRLVPAKQFEQLIRVFAQLAPEFPHWRLDIYGEGPQRAHLQEQIDSTTYQDRITLRGRTDTPWQVLSQAQLFVLTSAYEGFPNVLLEAMTLGLPCVTVDCPSGPKEMSRQGHDALLVPMNQDLALYQALEQLMQSSALRVDLGQRAALSVRDRYGMSTVLKQWDQLFEQAGLLSLQQES